MHSGVLASVAVLAGQALADCVHTSYPSHGLSRACTPDQWVRDLYKCGDGWVQRNADHYTVYPADDALVVLIMCKQAYPGDSAPEFQLASCTGRQGLVTILCPGDENAVSVEYVSPGGA
ncbi:hypothetical protein E4U53_007313 [Claviceps sorghi]|nr:hypothetical protein E4U53_007313 [Claviceps sorghi]